ncbi:MAG: nitrite reductase small subunit NirD [Sulfuricella sp.]
MSNWIKVVPLNEIPKLGARVVRHNGRDIAVFRTDGDEVFAMNDKCPHKGGQLSQGIVSGNSVTCPMHGMNISLADGKAVAPDEGCVGTYPVKVEAGVVYLQIM